MKEGENKNTINQINNNKAQEIFENGTENKKYK